MGKVFPQAQAGLLVILLATGCSILPGSGAETCVDWVWFKTPQEQYDQSGLVLIGQSAAEVGETSIYGYRATTHLVDVERVLKGEPADGPLRISSTPETCTGGDSYPHGDPLGTDERSIIFANQQDGAWFTLTPAQGVLPFKQGKELPFRPSSAPGRTSR
jgi:hypothetical protein